MDSVFIRAELACSMVTRYMLQADFALVIDDLWNDFILEETNVRQFD